MKLNILIALVSFVLTIQIPAFSLSPKPAVLPPMKPRAAQIEDGEFLRMGYYLGGEKTEDLYFVSHVDEKSKRLDLYLQMIRLKNPKPLPNDYTRYHSGRYTINMENANLIGQHQSFDDETNVNDPVNEDIAVDETNHIVTYNADVWDGNQMNRKRGRIQYKPQYPLWNLITVMYLGVRMLDIQSGGVINLIVPSVIKDAIPCTFSISGREEVTTPAGTFKTIKVSFAVADPFLSKLLAPYTRETVFWIEDAPRALLVKMKDPAGEEMVLEAFSNIIAAGLER